MEDLKIIGDVNSYNTTIVGLYDKLLDSLISTFRQKEFNILSMDNLTENAISDLTLEKIGIDNKRSLTSLQGKIIENIFSLIDQGIKKIVFKEILTFLDYDVRRALLLYLNENNVNFINITNDMEDTLYASYLIIIYNNKIALEGNYLDILKEERLLSRMGINLPFIVDISIQLKYYGLVDKIYLDKEELVGVLWK